MVNRAKAKELARRFLPAGLIARFRLHQQSIHAKVNVDVFLTDPGHLKRWLNSTPDTYRVRLDLPDEMAKAPGDLVEVWDPDLPPLMREIVSMAHRVMADPEVAAVIVGEVSPPKITRGYRFEPETGPRLVVARQDVLDEVDGVPRGTYPLPDLVSRLRSTGRRLALIPIPESGAPKQTEAIASGDSVVILAVVPLHDVGGGPRSTQLALEFARQGFDVTVVPMFEAQESVDLGLRFIHPNLRTARLDDFDAASAAMRAARPGLVLVEAPAWQLSQVAYKLQDHGWEVVYDLIDDWSDPALGWYWYRASDEQQLIERADRIIASAPDLVERVRIMRRKADLVPNAVNADLFGVNRLPRPDDMPLAEKIIGYHGSIYGDWLDWVQFEEVARAFPDAAVVVIGDDVDHRPRMPENVYFLGLKPQIELPAYLQHFDVGLIPFKVNQTTHSVSPLKVFEYLASGVPVAAPPLRALAGLESVHADYELVPMVDMALRSQKPDREAVLSQHSWTSRVSAIFPPEKRAPGTIETRRVAVTPRPVRHWAKDERLLR